MSFHSLTYPSNTLGVNVQRNSHKRSLNPLLGMPPSCILLPTGDGNFPESKKGSGLSTGSTVSLSNSLLGQANTVGIIGGVSVVSTLTFLRNLVEWSSKDSQNSLPFVLCSDPSLNKELISHEKNLFPSFNRSDSNPLDQMLIVENLKSKRIFLEKSGARCIVMPCHISHIWHEEVSKGCSVPFLHMGECVAKELKEAKLKPLEAGSHLRIGVLATNAILSAGFYQEKLQNEGFEIVLPDKATVERTVIPSIEALNRKDMEGARNLLRIALQVLLLRAVNTIILASDDMRDLLPRDDPLLKKCTDPMDALVRSTIKWAQTVEKDM